jgi:autotransporter translocation and assembly factor TamB
VQRRNISLAALVLAAVVAFVYRAPLSRAALAAALDLVSGYRISFASLELHLDRAALGGLRVARGNQTVLEARRAAIGFSLRDLFPGGSRRFGLRSIEVDSPVLTLARLRDGSFNLAGGGLGGAPSAAPGSGGAPLRFDANVSDGRILLLDPYRKLAGSRRLELAGLSVRAQVDSAALSHYVARARLSTAGVPGAAWPVAFDGRADVPRGFALYALRAARLPLPDIVNYLIDNPQAKVIAGEAREVEVRAYALDLNAAHPQGLHLAGSAQLSDGAIGIPGLLHGLRDIAGRLDLYDSGIAARRLQASAAGFPLQAAGGLFDWKAPVFRLGVRARAPLAKVRTLFAFSSKLALSGDLGLHALIEGPTADPLVATRFSAPGIAYLKFPLREVSGDAIYYGSSVVLAPVLARYGPVAIGLRGAVDLGATARSQLVLDALAPPRSLPYIAQAVPGVPLHATGLLQGADLKLVARGVFDGAGGGDRLVGVFDVDQQGDGVIGPLHAERADGSRLDGSYFANRIASESGFWLTARRFAFERVDPAPGLPGLPALQPPQFEGRVDGALAGEGHPSDFRIAGRVGGNIRVGDIVLDNFSADVLGTPNAVAVARVAANGPWGNFSGNGTIAGGGLALQGAYRGSFERLRSLTGDLGAHGDLSGPVALLVDSKRTVVQTAGVESPGATIAGVPLDGFRGTLAIAGKRLDVYAATAGIAGGLLAVRGTYAPGARLGVSLAGVDAGRLQATGSPLLRGSVDAIGSVTDNGGNPRFEGGVALSNSHVDRLDLAANGDVRADSAAVRVARASALVGPAYGLIDANVMRPGSSAQRYALDLRARDVPVGPFVRMFYPKRHDIAGTLDSDLTLAGAGHALPAVRGSLALAEGTYNGLAIGQGHATIDVAPSDLSARDGEIRVGSTVTAFSATLRDRTAVFRVDAPHANLSDFDDLFDTGDTLDGRGHVSGYFNKIGPFVATGADVDLAGFRYLRYDLGDAHAHWTSNGRRVDAQLSTGGASGRLDTAGTLTLANRAPLDKLLERSSFDGTARLRGLDLGVWLAAAGYQEPFRGRVDADATMRGPLANPVVRAQASLTGGAIGKLPVDRAALDFDVSLRRVTVHSASLDVASSLALTGSGSLGFGERDPLQLNVHAKTPDLGALTARLLGAKVALTGTGEADVKVDGLRANPRVSGGFDVESASLNGVGIPRALGEFDLQGRNVVLNGAELNFDKGSLQLAGSLPFTFSPFAFGPAGAPISLDLTAAGIDLTNFAPLLPRSSTLQGQLNGRIAIGGTAGAPRLSGALTLADGQLTAPFEAVPLSNIRARLAVEGNSVALEYFHAEAGGGALDATGNAKLPDLVHPGLDSNYALHGTAKALRLDLPAFGRGQIDGKLDLTHTPGAAPALALTAALKDATIPFAALLLAGGTQSAGPTLQIQPLQAPTGFPNVALAVDLSAGDNVRVRSGNVDIGARGSLAVTGTTGAPVLSGQFNSTGGTLTYFNTVFRVQSGTVSFRPDLGVIPALNAVATTHVINPDPNTIRNPGGSADIKIEVSGQVDNLNIQLSSDPTYDRQQILGLLLSAPAIGATNLFDPQTPGQPPTTVGSTGRTSVSTTVGQEAFGIVNAQFTRNLLAPIETAFGGALGLSNFAVNVGYTGGVGLSARKILGKNVDLIYATSFAYPYRQTFGFDIKPNASTAAQVTVFQSVGAYSLGSYATPLNSLLSNNQRATAAQPSNGSIGFSLSFQRLFP